jgi:rod shape-determining protein MreB
VFRSNIGIDLGTTTTNVYVEEQGIVLSEPSLLAINENIDEVVAIGNAAKDTIGRTPDNVLAIRPLKDGVIVDFEVTKKLLSSFIGKALPQHKVFRSSMLGPMVGPSVWYV